MRPQKAHKHESGDPFELYEASWIDASSAEGWSTEMPAPLACSSVGYLLYKSPAGIALAQSVSADDTYADIIAISWAMLTSLRPLGKLDFSDA